MCMATKTISISTEAYEKLKRLKEARESFSEVINRVAGKRSLLELAGILSHEEADTLMKTIKEGRGRSRKRSEKITRLMQE